MEERILEEGSEAVTQERAMKQRIRQKQTDELDREG